MSQHSVCTVDALHTIDPSFRRVRDRGTRRPSAETSLDLDAAPRTISNLRAVVPATHRWLADSARLAALLARVGRFETADRILPLRSPQPYPARASAGCAATPRGVQAPTDASVPSPY